MVQAIKFRFDFFQCEECGFVYKDKGLAENCEAYCGKHHSCNMKITQKGIPIRDYKKTKIK